MSLPEADGGQSIVAQLGDGVADKAGQVAVAGQQVLLAEVQVLIDLLRLHGDGRDARVQHYAVSILCSGRTHRQEGLTWRIPEWRREHTDSIRHCSISQAI